MSEWLQDAKWRLPTAPRLVLSGTGASTERLQSLLAEKGASKGVNSLALSLEMPSHALYNDNRPAIRTLSSALALQEASLGVVVLNHVVSDGQEPELEEACRVIQQGGRLFILGRNRMGLGRLFASAPAEMPAIRPLAVRSRLEALDMEVVVMHGAGLLGSAKPRKVHEGVARFFIPFAEVLLIVAKPIQPRIYTPLSSRKLRAVGGPSVLAGP